MALPPPTAISAPVTDIDKQAATEVTDARAALAAGNNEQAVQALNRALNLPPNAYSQEAQELIGIARERNGEIDKALAEYQLYLKLYPDSPGAARVRADLDAMAAPTVPMGGPFAPETAVAQPAFSYWGSLSQYYYGGQSETTNVRTITTPATNATTLDTAKISATDQSQLVNNVDLTARYRDGDWDSRFVWRDQYVANFLSGGTNKDWLNALYAETRYLPGQLMARIGRQSATSGGVLGLFDGAVGSWGFAPNYRLNAVVGQPVDNPFNTTSTFYGASVDLDKVGDRFSGSVFAIRQVAAGETDRLGIGGEFRYFDSERNVYSLIDYDPTFKALNIGMVQGTWQFPTLTTINALFDYRRTPTLQLTNALVAFPNLSLSTLIQQQGVDTVRDEAKELTPITKQALVGVTQQVSAQWQLGLDVRWSSLTGRSPVPGHAGNACHGKRVDVHGAGDRQRARQAAGHSRRQCRLPDGLSAARAKRRGRLPVCSAGRPDAGAFVQLVSSDRQSGAKADTAVPGVARLVPARTTICDRGAVRARAHEHRRCPDQRHDPALFLLHRLALGFLIPP